MTVSQHELTLFLNEYLNCQEYQDYGPNGLQIEGKSDIKKIAFCVSATQESAQKAVEIQADALIVHHGLFWKFHGPKTLTGAFGKRVLPLAKNEINLYGYHLPLDAHLEVGNAATVAQLIDLRELEPFGDHKGMPTGVKGKFSGPLKGSEVQNKLQKALGHPVIHAANDPESEISTMGIITGGASGDWTHSAAQGLDAYLTGEIKEHDYHDSKEAGLHMFAGGHHATEQFGVQHLKEKIAERFADKELELVYIPIHNPA